MPIYAYRCTACGHAQDVLRRISDPPLDTCPACGAGTFVKQVTAAGFQLKGSGWYVTDFRGDNKKSNKPAEGGDGAPAADAKAGEGAAAATAKDAPKDAKTADAGAAPAAAPAQAPAPATSPSPAPPASSSTPGKGGT